MGLILALEAATELGSVALGTEQGELLQARTIAPRRHSTEMAQAVVEVLAGADGGVRWEEIERVVVGDGPGSFTGLRIAFATALGLQRGARHLELSAIPSLAAAALGGREAGARTVAALFDALRGDVFAAIYRFGDNTVETLLEPCVTGLERLVSHEPPELCVGDGAERFRETVVEWTGVEPLSPPAGGPTAGRLLYLATIPGMMRDLEQDPEPRYGRLPAAQVRWEETSGRSLPHTAGPGS